MPASSRKEVRRAGTTYRVLAALRVLVSVAWLVLVFIWSDRAALFFSGALVATHASMMALVLLSTLNARLRPWPEARTVAETAVLIGVAVTDTAGLLALVLYAVNIYGAGLRAAEAADCSTLPAGATAVTQLSCAMWSREPAIVIVILALVAATFVMHVATLVVSAVHLHRIVTTTAAADL
jgi:hypothetical protein